MTKQDNSGQLETNLYVIAHNLGWYPMTAFLPCPPLNPIYPAVHGWSEALPWFVAGLALALAIVLLARFVHRRWTPGVIAVLMIGGAMVPVLGFLRYTDFAYCDRYNHIVAMVLWGSLAMLFGNTLLESKFRRLVLAFLGLAAVVETGTTIFYHQTVWQNDETLAIYCLTRPGEPNIKTLELGLTTGFAHANPNLLQTTAEAYLKYPHLTTIDGHPVPQELREALVHALLAHANFLQGDRHSAEQTLKTLPPDRLEELCNYSPSLLYAAEFLYRDLAALAADRRDKAAALYYLEMEATHLPPDLNHPATRQNLFLREKLSQ